MDSFVKPRNNELIDEMKRKKNEVYEEFYKYLEESRRFYDKYDIAFESYKFIKLMFGLKLLPALEASKGIRYPFYTNICKRHVDLTLLSHFPCSFNCEKSIEQAKKHLNLIGQIDRNLIMKFSKELKCKMNVRDRIVEFI